MLEVRTVEELKEAILIGDKIYIHPGVYDIVNYLQIKDETSLVGSTEGKTILRVRNELFDSMNFKNVSISNIYFEKV